MRFIHQRKFLLASLCLICIVTLFMLRHLFSPPASTSSSKVVFIKKGATLKKISELLEGEGVIRNAYFFSGLATILGKKAEIKAGEYEFHSRMLPLEVLDTLVKGQAKRHLVTIAEGYTLSQIAQRLEDLDIVKKAAFLEKATSPAFISSMGISEFAGHTLEGYLFPETYHLFKEMDPEDVIHIMVQQFRKVFGPEGMTRTAQSGLSEREAVILASIIEKETSLPEEKPLVSAVFHNRLKKKIPLQSDPTVIYGIQNFGGNLTREHLSIPTPYNTYLVAGLPPTPICNPGRESLHAALHPAPVPYLYFVSRNDGSHFFSSEIEDHNRAVWKYQRYPRTGNPQKNNLTKK
jgi:UPF0755 protein